MPRRRRVRIAIGVMFCGAMLAVAVEQVRNANARSSEATVLLAADSYLRTLEAVRDVYTSEVVDRLPDSILVTYDYEQHAHAVPLPATFTFKLAETLWASTEGINVRLYSDYPFPFRTAADLDAFERLALDSLQAAPDAVVSAIEGVGGERVLRYARGDTMRLDCVPCHNTHPQSPKTDWKVGDLRGVLAVSVPMIAFDQRARDARRPYTALLLLALIALMGAVVMLLGFFARLPGQGRRWPAATRSSGKLPDS